jgi:hypothetical protein
MHTEEIKPAIPGTNRPKTYALDCATTGIDIYSQLLA